MKNEDSGLIVETIYLEPKRLNPIII
jgi:hypothetical protein